MIKKIIQYLMEKPIFYKLVQEKLAGGGHSIIKNFLKKRIPKSAKKILDQGSGTGDYALLFGQRYTGIDVNPDYIEYSRRNFPGNFMVGTATKMPIKDGIFDIVFAVGLHHHLSDNDAKKAILESLRVVKKNGQVIIIDAMLPKNSFNLIGFILRKLDRGGYVRKFSKTLELIPSSFKYNHKILSSFPFDYIVITIQKD